MPDEGISSGRGFGSGGWLVGTENDDGVGLVEPVVGQVREVSTKEDRDVELRNQEASEGSLRRL